MKICQHFTNMQMEYNFIRIDNTNCEANSNTLCKEHRCEVILENNYDFVQGVVQFLNHKAIPYREAIHNYYILACQHLSFN